MKVSTQDDITTDDISNIKRKLYTRQKTLGLESTRSIMNSDPKESFYEDS